MGMVDSNLFALPGARAVSVALLCCSASGALAAAGQAWSLANALSGLWAGGGAAAAAGWAACFFACFAARHAVSLWRSSFMDRCSRRWADSLADSLAARMLEGGPAFVQERGTGAVSTAMLEGVDRVRRYTALVPPKLADAAVVPALLLAALFAVDWVSGLIALVALPCAVFFMGLLGSVAKEGAARQQGAYRRLANRFTDTLRGVGTLKLFGRAEGEEGRVYEASERLREATVATMRTATLSSLVLDLWGTFALAAVSIMLGFRLLDGTMGLLPALASLIIVPECFGALRRFASDFHASLEGREALSETLGAIGDGGEGAAFPGEAAAACARPWSEASTLALRDVRFSYGGDGEGDALRGVDLEIGGCERLGVVGESGSGKSTLAALLAGLASPTSGTVLVDGVACPGLRCDAWRSQVAFIPQAPRIFSASLRDNVAFYRPASTDGDVLRAIEAVGLADLLDGLPRGLDTMVGEGGRRLSGGQAQRVALARAFLDPGRKILVFDEPTAHLDIETELALKGPMLDLMEGRLVVFATHRMHWLDDMDRVAVLEGGRIAEAGAPGELLSRDGALRRLVEGVRGGGL